MKPMHLLPAGITAALLLVGAPRSVAGQQFKPGTYTTTVGGMTLEIQFSDSGTVTVMADNSVVVTGTFTIKGDEIELRDRSGPLACSDQQAGKYKWALVDKTLTLTLVSDECEGRTSLAGQPWLWSPSRP